MSVWPVSSWSSRARRRRSASCAATTRCSAVTGDPLGEIDRDRCPRGERLGQPEVVVGEARAGSDQLVVRGDHADRPVAHDERNPEARARGEPAVEIPVDGRLSGLDVEPLAVAAVEHGAARRARPRHPFVAKVEHAADRRPPRTEAAPCPPGAARQRRALRAARAAAPRPGRAAAAARSRSRARSRPRSATRAAATSALPRGRGRVSRRAASGS